MKERILEALFGDGGILRVRALLAFILVGLVGYGFLDGKVEGDTLVTLAATAVAFYFGQRTA